MINSSAGIRRQILKTMIEALLIVGAIFPRRGDTYWSGMSADQLSVFVRSCLCVSVVNSKISLRP